MKIDPITVTELNKYIKEKVASDEYLNNVLVKGEISNFKLHYTGHMYFTLKDESSLIKCIMFKSQTATLNFTPKDGTKVLVFGTVSVFERDGIYQVYAKAMQEDGVGALYTAYKELKAKLEKEGLFDSSHKQKIPLLPKTIGVLTSKTGSVIRDIINVSTRRNPNVYIRLLPVPVQGEGAAVKIADAIKLMNEKNLADVLIIARGGGSLEDLWPFNEEIVARAIYDSKIPIISAVGHETDFTIADFVADLRAPTPSAAAELAVPDVFELKKKIDIYRSKCMVQLKKKTELMRLRYEKCMKSKAYTMPLQRVNDERVRIDKNIKQIMNSINLKTNNEKANLGKVIAKLDTLSPLKTLARGYCLTEKGKKIISSVNELETGDNINIVLKDGKKEAKIL